MGLNIPENLTLGIGKALGEIARASDSVRNNMIRVLVAGGLAITPLSGCKSTSEDETTLNFLECVAKQGSFSVYHEGESFVINLNFDEIISITDQNKTTHVKISQGGVKELKIGKFTFSDLIKIISEGTICRANSPELQNTYKGRDLIPLIRVINDHKK